MNVERAANAGACYGVQRALDMAEDVLREGRQAYTLGPLIHNPRVVNDLARRGAHEVSSLDEVDLGHVASEQEVPAVIIRSHGVTPDVYKEAKRRGFEVVDATCPHVARAQHAAAELGRSGYCVIVVGEAGHPEVEGLRAWAHEAGASVAVVAEPKDLPHDVHDPVGVVVQTTQRHEKLDAILSALTAKGLHPLVKDTICMATRKRQETAAELASKVDAMVIIGGRNSSNTTRLAEICQALCARTYHVESADELQSSWFDQCERVGVTAGASTPEDQIDAVIRHLKAL